MLEEEQFQSYAKEVIAEAVSKDRNPYPLRKARGWKFHFNFWSMLALKQKFYLDKRLLKLALEAVAVQNSVESVAWNHLTWPVIILVSKCQITLNDTQHSSSKRNSIQLVKKDENDLVLSGPKNNYTTTNIKQNCLTKINIIYSYVIFILSCIEIVHLSCGEQISSMD